MLEHMQFLELRLDGFRLADRDHLGILVRREKTDRCRHRHGDPVIAAHAIDGNFDRHCFWSRRAIALTLTRPPARSCPDGPAERRLAAVPATGRSNPFRARNKSGNELAAFLYLA